MRKTLFRLLSIIVVAGVIESIAAAQLLGPQDVNKLPSTPADHRIPYGKDPLQFGDLRLPKSNGRHPVAVVIHGGCWKSVFADLQGTAPLASALTAAGIATWNIEYRRIDNPGGGWTGTFEDVAGAVDYLRLLAKTYPLDLKRVVVLGHSAGGHLAHWVVARHRLAKQSPLFTKKPLRAVGVINLAGPARLESFLTLQSQICGDQVITKLIGGTPSEKPERYQDASPANLLPIGVKQILITGTRDGAVPPRFGKEYEEAAKKKGDDVRSIVIENAGHFEVIAPGSIAWPTVEENVLAMLKIKKAPAK